MKYELKKLFSYKFLIFVMLLLLCTNCVLAYRAAPNDKEWQEALNAFYTDYKQNASAYDKRYNEYLTVREQAINNQIEAVLRGEDPDAYAFEEPRTIAPDSGYTDIEFYTAVYSRKEYGEQYRERLKQIIKDTENNLKVVTDPYMRAYLSDVKETYTAMYSLQHSESSISGWEAYFSYNGMGILLLFGVIIAALLLATGDNDTGTEPILSVSAKGFCGVIGHKIIALFMFCLLGVIAFEGSAFVLFCTATSFAGAGEFLASVESYMLCPFAIYIYEYALIRILLQVLVLFSVGVFLLLIARLIPISFGYLAFSVAFVGVHYVLNTTPTALGSAWGSLNLFHILDFSNCFSRYTSVNIWGYSLPLPVAVIALCIVILFVCIAGLLLLWKKTQNRKRLTVKLPTLPSYTPRSALGFECKKLLFGQKLLIPLVILISIKLITYAAASNQTIPYKEQLYRNYMLTLQGEVNKEKDHFLEEEQISFSELFEKSDENQRRYECGEITYAELLASNLALRSAEKQYEIFLEVKEEYDRIRQLNSQGIPAKIVYETGWKKLLLGGPDLLLILVPVLGSFAYSIENKEKLRHILHGTAGGRSKMFWQKLFICTAFAIACCVLFSLLDLWSISKSYPLPERNAVLESVAGLAFAAKSLTLGGALLLLFLKRMILSVLLTCIAVLASQTTRSSLSAPLIFTAGLFIPHGIYLLVGGDTWIVSAPNLFCFSTELDVKSLPILLVIITVFAILLIRTRRQLTEKKPKGVL